MWMVFWAFLDLYGRIGSLDGFSTWKCYWPELKIVTSSLQFILHFRLRGYRYAISVTVMPTSSCFGVQFFEALQDDPSFLLRSWILKDTPFCGLIFMSSSNSHSHPNRMQTKRPIQCHNLILWTNLDIPNPNLNTRKGNTPKSKKCCLNNVIQGSN
jgi:hypothetical protein